MVRQGNGRLTIQEISAKISSYLTLSAQPKPLRLIYSSTPAWPFEESKIENSPPPPQQQIDIGVLDSSFNPPHKAHHALATSIKPAFLDETKSIRAKEQYDAILLLFSVRNADKGLGSSKDATPSQRIEMMQLMAEELERERSMNVAVGIVEEPLMITKSTLIHDFIKEERKENHISGIRLHWLVGFDTLQRFFQIKYYPSPEYFVKACQAFFEQERTTFVCARRMIRNTNAEKEAEQQSWQKAEIELLESNEVRPWKERGSVVMIDLPSSVQDVSSTAIRKTVQEQGSQTDKELEGRLSEMTSSMIASHLVQERLYRE